MIPDDIRQKINNWYYNFETVEYLLDYERKKETLPVTRSILEMLEEFDRILSGDSGSPAQSEFQKLLDTQGPGGTTYRQASAKFIELARDPLNVSQKELEGFYYEQFLEKIKKVGKKQIIGIRKKYQTAAERKIEQMVWGGCFVAVGMVVIGVIFYQFMIQDWGLLGDFYAGTNFETKVATAISKKIDFYSNLDMSKRVPAENFSAKWSGFLEVPKDGKYSFFLTLDDGGRLTVNGKMVIDSWIPQSSVEHSGQIVLKKGTYPIALDFFQGGGGVRLTLTWEAEGMKKEVIPAKYLRWKKEN